VHVTEGLQSAFENGDPRRFYTLFSAGEDYVGTPYDPAWSVTGSTPAKYVRQSMDLTIFPLNITTNNERVIRYADVLLMLAEAKLLDNSDAAGAAALVNQVRQRARTTYEILHGQPAPPGLLQDKATLTHADIRQERRVEFALEVHRYDDLVRWHRAGLIDIRTEIDFGNTIANQNWSEVNLLKPIPQRELDNNPNLSQNTGY
jgi:starch-binding outer membrane protein, SusD/RagB family